MLDTSDDARLDASMAAYRARFDTVGIFENRVCPGIPEALAELRARGYAIVVVTAKPTVYAKRILDHFALSRFVEATCGPQLTSRGYTKTSLIRDALEATGFPSETVTMVGDRGEDVIGARANGIGAVGVTWGYGQIEELIHASPDFLIHSTRELIAVLGEWR